MLKLEKGMYIRLLEDVTYYDPKTFEPHVVTAGTFGEIDYLGVGLPRDAHCPPVPIISVKFKDAELTYTGESYHEFRKMFEVV